MIVLIVMARGNPSPWYFAPGLFLMGTGVGLMLTPSVNVVQSAFPENLQGEISGLSRSISNLGSSLGTAIAGTILVAGLGEGNQSYGYAILALACMGLIGLVAAIFIPRAETPAGARGPEHGRRGRIARARGGAPVTPLRQGWRVGVRGR